MRKANFIVIALALFVGLSACSRGVTKPGEIGDQVFKVLKAFDDKGNEGFKKNFPAIHKLRDMGKNEKITSNMKIRNEMTSTSEEVWLKQISDCYSDIKKMGVRNSINWCDIEYVDFVYEMDYEDAGLKFVEGELVIRHANEMYKVATYSVWNGKEYMLLQVEDYY